MARFHVVYTAGNPNPVSTPFTAEEEAAADAAEASSRLADLNRIQFEFMVEKLQIGPAIETAIAAMPDETDDQQNAKIMARVLYRSGQKFERSHELFTDLAEVVGFSPEQIDAAWVVALSI